jgi:hypothetical protein
VHSDIPRHADLQFHVRRWMIQVRASGCVVERGVCVCVQRAVLHLGRLRDCRGVFLAQAEPPARCLAPSEQQAYALVRLGCDGVYRGRGVAGLRNK